MSYIWEDKNRGKSLFEMALGKKLALAEATFKLRDADAGTKNTVLGSLKKKLGLPDADFDAKVKITDDPSTGEAVLEIDDNVYGTPKGKHAVDFLQSKSFIVGPDAAKKQADSQNNNREKIINSLIGQLPGKDDELKNDVAFAVRCISNGMWFDGSKIDPADTGKAETAAKFKKAILDGNIETARGCLMTLAGSISSGRIEVDPNNPGLYRTKNKDKQVTGNIRMPAMFDSEPDDSMWDDMIVTEFGMALVNLGHPAVSKIIKSDNPEEDCPADLKAFKKAVYGDKRLTAVFGEGGLARMLGKMANLCTLGIAGATVDAGKRADRIIKELHEKGGRIVHRNLLLVKADDIMYADPDNDELTIPCTAYCRSKKKFVGSSFDVPAAALKQFYSAVDPIKSTKIYVEMYSNFPEAESALTESANFDGNVLVEGPFSAIAGGLRKATDKLHITDKADDPSKKKDGGKISELKEKFISYIRKNGNPPYYVLKPKSDNMEVDVVSTSKTGQAGTSGKAVHMVTMKIGEHKAAAFMNPEEIKNYFSV